MEQFTRAAWLLGDAAMEKLKQSRVAVFGIGGVGGYVAEALVRSGVGALDFIDNDTVSISNLNRQIVALHSTVGEYKTEVMARRALDINPDCKIKTFNTFYTPESVEFDFSSYDYVVDAVDTVSAKLAIVENAMRVGTPVISAMGAGNKLNAAAFEVADISKTSVCPLAKAMRRELKKRGIEHLKVVYSKEEPVKVELPDGVELPQGKKTVPGSVAFVPSVMGLLLAGEVIKDLVK